MSAFFVNILIIPKKILTFWINNFNFHQKKIFCFKIKNLNCNIQIYQNPPIYLIGQTCLYTYDYQSYKHIKRGSIIHKSDNKQEINNQVENLSYFYCCWAVTLFYTNTWIINVKWKTLSISPTKLPTQKNVPIYVENYHHKHVRYLDTTLT